MKTREQLVQTKGFWMTTIQNKLYACVEDYMKLKGINRTQLAQELGVTKGYVSQVLNGDFNGRLSKLVELALAVKVVPNIDFTPLEDFIEQDKSGYYNINHNQPHQLLIKIEAPRENKEKMPLPIRYNSVGPFKSSDAILIDYPTSTHYKNLV